jgi:hypothetical protein
MNNFDLCREVCELNPAMLGVGIIENANLVAVYAKPESPVPNEEKFKRLFFQTEVIAGITRTNADFFGQPRLFSIYFENSDMYFFHLFKYPERRGVLAIMLGRDKYVHEELVSSVMKYLDDALAAPL